MFISDGSVKEKKCSQSDYIAGVVGRERHQVDGSIQPATRQPVCDA